MTSRERILNTLRFKKTDKVPTVLQLGHLYPENIEFFNNEYGLKDLDEIQNFLGSDMRWTYIQYGGPPEYNIYPDSSKEEDLKSLFSYTDSTLRPLSNATSISDIEKYKWPDPDWLILPDFKAFREKWPDHAIGFYTGWWRMTLFCHSCEEFGMEEALVKMQTEPELYDAFIRKQHEYFMKVLDKSIKAAKGYVDMFSIGDDYAGQENMLINPVLWRKHIKPYIAEQVKFIRDNGIAVTFHSCGAVRSILPDLIEIGIDALDVFQTTAKGMDPESIARDFGGKLAFMGGIDVQNLMIFGTEEDVKREVFRNLKAFEKYGGYVVQNSHNIQGIKPKNILAMFKAAREYDALKK